MINQEAPATYSQSAWQQIINAIRSSFDKMHRKDQHLELRPETYIIMQDSNGVRYSLTVNTSGVLVVTSL